MAECQGCNHSTIGSTQASFLQSCEKKAALASGYVVELHLLRSNSATNLHLRLTEPPSAATCCLIYQLKETTGSTCRCEKPTISNKSFSLAVLLFLSPSSESKAYTKCLRALGPLFEPNYHNCSLPVLLFLY